MLGLHDGLFLQEHPRLAFGWSALGDRFAVSSLHFVFLLVEWRGERGKDCASPWLGVVKDSNSLWDRIYDVKGMGRYDEARRTARCQGGRPYNRRACYHMIWP